MESDLPVGVSIKNGHMLTQQNGFQMRPFFLRHMLSPKKCSWGNIKETVKSHSFKPRKKQISFSYTSVIFHTSIAADPPRRLQGPS